MQQKTTYKINGTLMIANDNVRPIRQVDQMMSTVECDIHREYAEEPRITPAHPSFDFFFLMI